MIGALTYRLFDVLVRSELALSAPYAESGAAQINIIRQPDRLVADEAPPGIVVADMGRAGQRLITGVEDDEGHLLRFLRTCEFRIDPELASVSCVKSLEVPDELVSVLTTGTFMAYILALRGRPTLHGSAIELDGRAVALLGHSGTGKSTAAALLCATGARLLTDDVLLADGVDEVLVHPGATSIRLRRPAWGILNLFDEMTSRRLTIDERIALAPPGAPDPAPLAAMLLPRPSRGPGPVRLDRISPVEALVQLGGFHRIGGLRASRLLRDQFLFQGELISRVPLFSATIPWGPPFTRDLAEQLRDAVMRELP